MIRTSVLSLFFLFACGSLIAQEELEDYAPGLVASYSDRVNHAREIVSHLAFDWEQASPDPRIAADSFTVAWKGFLLTRGVGDFALMAYADGDVNIKLDEQLILNSRSNSPQWSTAKPLELSFGWHPLEVTFKKTSPTARIALFWSGPGFQLEPIGSQFLFHRSETSIDTSFRHGQQLVRALRCNACHELPNANEVLLAPDLTNVATNLNAAWLVQWLSTSQSHDNDSSMRRMPEFAMTRSQAEAIAAYLVAKSQPSKQLTAEPNLTKEKTNVKPKKSGNESKLPETRDEKIAAGEQLALSVGCVACHQIGEIGERNWFDGGDLSNIASKRPPAFFATWLSNPEAVNSHHRMPKFDLSELEVEYLSLYLQSLGKTVEAKPGELDKNQIAEGRELISKLQCAACHIVPEQPQLTKVAIEKLDASASCVAETPNPSNQPNYHLSHDDRTAVLKWLTFGKTIQRDAALESTAASGERLMHEHNCLACHRREERLGISKQFPKLTTTHPELASRLPALSPPPLTNVGDKLNDDALRMAISREEPNEKNQKPSLQHIRRPWLDVRMPKFEFNEKALSRLLAYFVASDRMPDRADSTLDVYRQKLDATKSIAMQLAGMRLVTTDGFGCTSCHQIGRVAPPAGPLSARGPNLSMLGRRIRLSWFDRWTRNPARIVPGMEMPAVQVPVHGVLEAHLNDQLAAVWQILNTENFEPPQPNPIRVVRQSGQEMDAQTRVLMDLVRTRDTTFIKPLVLGFPNRHNLLLDLETNRLASWWIGDVARQRTEGKSWYWELGGASLFTDNPESTDIEIQQKEVWVQPKHVGQFRSEIDTVSHTSRGLRLQHRIGFEGCNSNEPVVCRVEQAMNWLSTDETNGVHRQVDLLGLPAGSPVRCYLLPSLELSSSQLSKDRKRFSSTGGIPIRVELDPSSSLQLSVNERGLYVEQSASDKGFCRVAATYSAIAPVDHFPRVAVPSPKIAPKRLDIAPGFEAIRLPMSDEVMPIGLGWRKDGTLVIASLKGLVWLAKDTDGDQLEDRLTVFSEELAAPYGVATHGNAIDVATKSALLRLFDDNGDGHADRMQRLASGWGHTTDYHDWVVGLPRDKSGNYYIALPCQQDDRSLAAATYRGQVLRLVSREPTPEEPSLYSIDPISGGFRFPMGIALNRDGELFVTDNQGNYTPFNELNHVRRGLRYGFINKLEKKDPNFQPPMTAPAIDIPHPWTRSVNGICFLETPAGLASQGKRFGPFEGHLVGCEFNTNRLIRMSLQRVGDTFQGAAYPLTLDVTEDKTGLQGPTVCAVSPNGDLVVGTLLDSGWGGGNNVGSVVRLRPTGELPLGIAEVRATKTGFEMEFTNKVSFARAQDPKNYSIVSYRRESTPGYGGEDKDRRVESIAHLELIENQRIVTITINDLREEFLYEFQVKNLTNDSSLFFPAEAHFTLIKGGK